MLKTAQEIVDDFYQLIKDGVLGKAIAGTIYNGGTSLEQDEEIRRADADTEDLIIKWHGGTDTQMQTGEIILHIYISDITTKRGTNVEDMNRCNELCKLVNQWIWEDASEYTIKTVNTPHLSKVSGINQHILVARLQYWRAAS